MEEIKENYYLDENDNIYKPCDINCKKCKGKNNNCTECFQNFIKINEPNQLNYCLKCEFYYFFNDLEKNYSCTEDFKCPDNHKNLIVEKSKCINKCKDDDLYKYEYNNTCYEKCPNNTYANNEFICYDNKEEHETEDISIDIEITNIKESLTKGEMKNIVNNVTKNNQIYSEKIGDTILYLLTTEIQKNNSNINISTIDLGKCETELKDAYNISKDLPLLMLKLDYFQNDSLIPIIGYEVYDPITLELLNLSKCNTSDVLLYIPVKIDENNLFKYDPKSKFYTSNCFSYSTEDGTDIIVKDRKKEYGDKNLSLCENKCSYLGYDTDNKQSQCICKIKMEMEKISEINKNPNKLSNEFALEKNSRSSSPINSLECTDTLFTKDGLKSNISSYILSIIFIYYLLSIIIFIKCGMPIFKSEINTIINSKEKEIKRKKKRSIIDGKISSTQNTTRKKKNKNKQYPPKKSIKINNNFMNNNKNKKYNRQMNFNNFSMNNLNKFRSNKKTKSQKQSINKMIENNENEKRSEKIKFNKQHFNDYELNIMEYPQAIIYDKRSCCDYYISLLKAKHPFIFGFCPVKDYNIMIIKSCIFFLSFSIYYAINFLFFNEETIHRIYEEEGKYDILYFLPQISLSFVISHIITIIIKYIFLSERNLYEIKKKKNHSEAVNVSEKVEKNLIIKYTFFYIMGLIFLVVFWLFLSAFGAVYQNTQIILAENTIFSFAISFIYPFFINIIPCMFRIYSLSDKEKNSTFLYKLSKFLQLL